MNTQKNKFLSKSLVILIFLSVLSLNSCKKYEDGPSISLITKKARLCKEWKLESSTFPPGGLLIGYNPAHTFEKDGTYNEGNNGTWKFNENKEKIITEINNNKDTFFILRLTDKELWFYWHHHFFDNTLDSIYGTIYEDHYVPYE